ncbi:MAG TPA: terminase [Acidobacteriaceae bacterium]|nr:terminase [Acidobacteriaceae bacterium]
MGTRVPLIANKAQERYEQNRLQSNIVLKARQLGITTWIAGRFFLKTITHPGTLTVQVAHTQEAAESIFRIVHRFLRWLPPSLCRGALKTSQVSARQIVFPGMDSEYRVETAGAPNAGRGLTITNLHCSEVARWPGEPEEILQGLRAALSPAGELALESTPMGAAGCFWKEWQDAQRTGMAQHFFPWWLEEAYVGPAIEEAALMEEERQLMEREHLTPKQIGYRRQIQRNFRGLAKQEYAESATECFLASGECIFDTASIDARLREVSDPEEQRNHGTLRIWLRWVPSRRYLVAVDPAGGGSEGDYSAAQVIDLDTGLQCAELRAHLPPLELAQEVATLAREYNHALVAVERNNHGSGVLAYLGSVCRYEPLYRTGGQEGFVTSSITRPTMLGRLGSVLVESPDSFASDRLLRECRSFVRHANGRAEAQAGEHDDCVMAMAIALAVREEWLTEQGRSSSMKSPEAA